MNKLIGPMNCKYSIAYFKTPLLYIKNNNTCDFCGVLYWKKKPF